MLQTLGKVSQELGLVPSLSVPSHFASLLWGELETKNKIKHFKIRPHIIYHKMQHDLGSIIQRIQRCDRKSSILFLNNYQFPS